MHGITGEYLLPTSSRAPSLETIALALARTPRWRGVTRSFFPVLAHSYLASTLIAYPYHLAHPMRAELQLHALLHDAAETITGDLPSTWKTEADRAREEAIQRQIYDSLDIGGLWPLTPELREAVDEVDLLARRAEATVLEHPSTQDNADGYIPPIYMETEPQLSYALEAARVMAATCRCYPRWLETGSERQVEYCRQVRILIAAVTGRGTRCPACNARLPNDGSCCDRCGWVRP